MLSASASLQTQFLWGCGRSCDVPFHLISKTLGQIGIWLLTWLFSWLSVSRNVKNQCDKGHFWCICGPNLNKPCMYMVHTCPSILSYIISLSLSYCNEIMNSLKAGDMPFFPHSVLPWAEPCSCSININWINQLPQHRCTHLSALCFLPATNTTCAFSCPCRSIGPTTSGPAQTFYSCALSRQTPFAKYALRSVRPASPCTHSLCNTFTQLEGLYNSLFLSHFLFPDPSKGLRRMRSTPHSTSGAGFLITV